MYTHTVTVVYTHTHTHVTEDESIYLYTIAVINQKGGVGKSTSAHAIGSGLHLRGERVLFIDLDAQCNLSSTLTTEQEPNQDNATILDVITGKEPALSALVQTEYGSLLSGDCALSGADIILTEVGKEYRVRELLNPLTDRFDYVIIDTPPALGILTINALAASNGCIIPAGADIYSLQGITALRGTIEAVRKYCNPNLEIMGILLTRYNGRTVITRDAEDLTAQSAAQFGTKLYQSKIRECTAIKEAQAVKKSIFDYAPKSNAAVDYSALIDEISHR